MAHKDYYRILGVSPEADVKQVKDAYRELALKYHPDRNQGHPEVTEKMKALNEAYAVLSNPEKRREYDALRSQFGPSAYTQFRRTYSEQDIFRGSDLFNFFDEISKGFGFRGYEEIFREFYGKGFRSFEFQKPGIKARGFVFFGPFGGSGQGSRRLQAGGGLGRLPGYLLEKITGARLPQAGGDLQADIELTPQFAQQGGPFAYFHRPKKKRLVVQIPPGVRDGQRIRLTGMGREGKAGGQPGDLLLRVRIRLPLLQKLKRFFSVRRS
ncbi:MAG: DnaJ domain-containing protein [Desulfobacterales bacterium]|nr:DnaJ domain-containing protein [Desulfobacterales bacterium]